MNEWDSFERIFSKENKKFYLPIRRDNKSFYDELHSLLDDYQEAVSNEYSAVDRELCKCVEYVSSMVEDIVLTSQHGYPATAYNYMEQLMEQLKKAPVYEDISKVPGLYRVRKVNDNRKYTRKDIFHIPYNKRENISIQRYSISGYPCLYLASSIELAVMETGISGSRDNAIAAKFFIEKNSANICILDMSYRPQDLEIEKKGFRNRFSEEVLYTDELNGKKNRKHSDVSGNNVSAPKRYIIWYPLIAACSFMRSNRDNSYAPEYIIPQILTQWLRGQGHGKVFGIKYFSCACVSASEMGVNYVFPTCGDPMITKNGSEPFCPLLNEAFLLTSPEYLIEHDNVRELKNKINNPRNIIESTFPIREFAKESKVRIPNDVIFIAANTFDGCYNLEIVDWQKSRPKGIGEYAFSSCRRLKSIKIPDGVSTIGDCAFFRCLTIDSIEIPDSVKTIGDYAFADCCALKNIKIPANVTSIGKGLFSGCSGLESIEIPDSLINNTDWGFEKHSNIKIIKYPIISQSRI